MAHVSVTKARPMPVWRHEAKEVMHRIISLQIAQPGSLFQGTSDVKEDGALVLLGLWRDRDAAAAAAAIPAVRRLRTQLSSLCAATPEEEVYDLFGATRVKDLRVIQVA